MSANGMVRPCSCPASDKLATGAQTRSTQCPEQQIAVVGVDIGKNSFDVVALDDGGVTRVLLNLISDGFYAATKRKGETKADDYEPTLLALTKNLGDSVDIRIRDNGTGIPPGVKEKMFNPFFTTKPAGEGTGLGLSISHDIIVKQHSGSIEVDSKPGEYTEIRIVLPRAGVGIAAGQH
jgi:signal transduction histidine kinase